MAAELARRGMASIDTDADPRLARFVDGAGRVVQRPADPDFAWLARHRWEWDPVRMEEVLARVSAGTLFVCGGASNETDFFACFQQVFLLEIDEPTMLRRLDDPDRANDFGRTGDTREQLRRWLPDYQARMRARGAVVIDATVPLGSVVDAILARVFSPRERE